MDELTIPSDIMDDLVERMRGYMAREDVPAPARQPDESEDENYAFSMESRAGDPQRKELWDEIDGLDDEHQAELVALMWIGRGDFEPEDWDTAIREAVQRHDGPTADYLLSHPLVADYWSDGLEALRGD